MFYALTWFVVFSLVTLWSLTAWALHAVVTWTISSTGVLAAGSGATAGLRMPDWLAPWVPPELAEALTSMVSALAPAVEAMLAWAPALAGGVSVAVWVIWALGSILIILLGFVLSAVIAVLRRRSTAPAVSPTGSVAAR